MCFAIDSEFTRSVTSSQLAHKNFFNDLLSFRIILCKSLVLVILFQDQKSSDFAVHFSAIPTFSHVFKIREEIPVVHMNHLQRMVGEILTDGALFFPSRQKLLLDCFPNLPQ